MKANFQVLEAYLQGAFHDGTSNRFHRTYRFCQKERNWLELLQDYLRQLGHRSWLYKEGKNRNLFVLETTASFLATKITPVSLQTADEKAAYIRGYFDAEGGIPSSMDVRFYIQFCQKNYRELFELKEIIGHFGIKSGSIHVPSKKVDPDYFRFYISSSSHDRFIRLIGSSHPRKQPLFNIRMKI